MTPWCVVMVGKASPSGDRHPVAARTTNEAATSRKPGAARNPVAAVPPCGPLMDSERSLGHGSDPGQSRKPRSHDMARRGAPGHHKPPRWSFDAPTRTCCRNCANRPGTRHDAVPRMRVAGRRSDRTEIFPPRWRGLRRFSHYRIGMAGWPVGPLAGPSPPLPFTDSLLKPPRSSANPGPGSAGWPATTPRSQAHGCP